MSRTATQYLCNKKKNICVTQKKILPQSGKGEETQWSEIIFFGPACCVKIHHKAVTLVENP